MNIFDNYVSIIVDNSWFCYLCLPWSFIRNFIRSEIDKIHDLYSYKFYKRLIGMIIADKYVGIFVTKRL